MKDCITREDLIEIINPFIDIVHAKYRFRPRHDIRCGLKSNIPLCCILFFLVFWQIIFIFVHFSIVRKFVSWYPPEPCGYVPCVFCVIRKSFRKVHDCSASDPHCCMFLFLFVHLTSNYPVSFCKVISCLLNYVFLILSISR